MAEEVVFGDFDAPSDAGYESRVVRTAFVGDSKDKLFFRVYFINLVGRNEWADSPAGRARQDEVLKSVASSVPSHGAVGFAVCFPHTCKIYQFDVQQETRLCARTYDPKKGFAEVSPKRAGGVDIGCAAEVLIVADEMRSWMRSETVEQHARRKDALQGNAQCAKPQKLRDYLATATPTTVKAGPAVKTMEDVEKELAQKQKPAASTPAPAPSPVPAPAPAPKRAWGGQRPAVAAEAPPPAAAAQQRAATPAPAPAARPASGRAPRPQSAPSTQVLSDGPGESAGGDDDGWQEAAMSTRRGKKKASAKQGAVKRSRARGVMVWFDAGKGYGFIKPDPPSGTARAGGQHTRDIFVHKDAVNASGITKFEKDQRLIFDIMVREGRDVAVNLEKA